MQNNLCFELLEVIEKQDEIIKKEKQFIKRLVEDNVEKENIINELMRQHSIGSSDLSNQ